jgi:N6-L-threonylcarbamoyladenine synthase
MSFSGIKTSVLYYLNAFDDEQRRKHVERHLSDLCASFQAAVVDMLEGPVRAAVEETGITTLAVAGGVSANSGLRRRFSELASSIGGDVFFPEPRFRTDNAAMIAAAGRRRLLAGLENTYALTIDPSLAFSSHG